MAHCKLDNQCSKFGIRMTCLDEQCGCDTTKYVLLEKHWFERGCYVKANLFADCIVSEQCIAMNRNTYCNRNNRCTCSPGYYFDGRDCIVRYDSNLKAQEVYKAAVVAAACFIVAVVGIFVACIVRRSFCRRESNVQHSSSSSSDIFSISDEIAALRAVDKPPSYEEVLRIERSFYGIPPPEYNFSGENPLHIDQRDSARNVQLMDSSSQIADTVQSSSPLHNTSVTTAVINNSADFSDDSILSSVWCPVVPRLNFPSESLLSSGSPIMPHRSTSTLSQYPLSASAPNSPRLVTHASQLQRLSSLKLHMTQPVVPLSQPAHIPTETSGGRLSNLVCSRDSSSAYDNPAFIDDQK